MKLDDTVFPKIPGRKSREQKRAERKARGEAIALNRSKGDNKGWEVRESDGMPVWQMIEGGEFQPV